jgi:hypothetical protein
MPTLHATSTFNVEATLNQWLQNGLAALTRPSWLPAYTLIFNEPETPLSPPAFGIVHHPGGHDSVWMGNNPGVLAAGVLEITAVVARGPNANAQLKAMQSMVENVAAGETSLVIHDYLSAPASPTPTTYQVALGDLEIRESPPVPNLDLLQRRLRLRYTWVLRSA